jgi:hypothetical protein
MSTYELIGVVAAVIAGCAMVVAAYAKGRADGIEDAMVEMDRLDHDAFCEEQANAHYK